MHLPQQTREKLIRVHEALSTSRKTKTGHIHRVYSSFIKRVDAVLSADEDTSTDELKTKFLVEVYKFNDSIFNVDIYQDYIYGPFDTEGVRFLCIIVNDVIITSVELGSMRTLVSRLQDIKKLNFMVKYHRISFERVVLQMKKFGINDVSYLLKMWTHHKPQETLDAYKEYLDLEKLSKV